MKDILMKRESGYWFALYTPMGLVSQGKNPVNCLINLIKVITIHVSYGIETENYSNIFVGLDERRKGIEDWKAE